MARLEPVLLARSWDRVGVDDESIAPSVIQYCPCLLPPPTLMRTSWLICSVLRSWAMDLLCHGSVAMKADVDGRVVVRLGLVIRIVGDVECRLALMGHSIGREDGARLTTM
jgi:hypothetical protein